MDSKLKQIMDSKDISVSQLNNAVGNLGGNNRINDVYKGFQTIENLRLETVLKVANFLNISIYDLLEPWEIDGTNAKIKTLKRQLERVKKKCSQVENVGKVEKVGKISPCVRASAYTDNTVDSTDTENTGDGKYPHAHVYRAQVHLERLERIPSANGVEGRQNTAVRGDVAEDSAEDSAQNIPVRESVVNVKPKTRVRNTESKIKNGVLVDYNGRPIKHPEREGRYHVSNMPTVFEVEEISPGEGELRLACSYLKKSNNEFLGSDYFKAHYKVDGMDRAVHYYMKKTLDPIEPDDLNFDGMQEIDEEEFYKGIFPHYNKFKISR